MSRRLRMSHVAIQVHLVWDDGEELVPGPSMQPMLLPPSLVDDYLTEVPNQLPRIEAELIVKDAAEKVEADA